MALFSHLYALIAPRLKEDFGEISSSKSARMTKLRQFSQSHPISAFSKKVQRVDQRKFFKKRLKISPHLKGPEALQHKWYYHLISMHFKGKDWRRFWSKKAAPKVPEWPSYGNFWKVTQKPHFLKKCKAGPKEVFQQSPKKMPSLKSPKSTLAQMALSSYQYALKVQRLEDLGANSGLKRARIAKFWQFSRVTQNLHFLEKCKGETKRSFSKIAQKVTLASRGQQVLWRKCHYPLNCIHL